MNDLMTLCKNRLVSLSGIAESVFSQDHKNNKSSESVKDEKGCGARTKTQTVVGVRLQVSS